MNRKKVSKPIGKFLAIFLALLVTLSYTMPSSPVMAEEKSQEPLQQEEQLNPSEEVTDESSENGSVTNDEQTVTPATDSGEEKDGEAAEQEVTEEEKSDNVKAKTHKISKNILKAPAVPNIGSNPKDFRDKITAVEVQRQGSSQTTWSKVDDDNPVKTGDDVKFILDFTLPARFLYDEKDGKTEITNTIRYEILPPIGQIHPESGDVKNSAGMKIGKYTIEPQSGESPTGIITIVFDDPIVIANQRARLDSSVEFTSTVDGWKGKDAGVEEVPVGGDVGDIEIIIQPEDAVGDIKIRKATKNYNNRTGEITYTMDVTSTSGTKTDVTIDDTMVYEVMKGDGNFEVTHTTAPGEGQTTESIEPKSIKYRNNDGEYEDKWTDEDGVHNSGFEMILPELKPNEKYTITYDAYYPKMVNGSLTVRNTAVAKSTDEEDKLLISTSSVSNSLSNKPLDKTGELIEVTDDESGDVKYFVEWTVKINPNRVDVGGWSLKDTGLYNFRESDDPEKALEKKFLTASDVQLIILNEDGSEGEVIELENVELNGENVMYTFPEEDSNAYVLKYRTAMDFDDNYYEAKNTIMMDPPEGDKDNEENSSSSTTPGIKGIETNKEHDDIEVDLSSNPPTAKINWTIELDAMTTGIPAGSTFADTLGNDQKFDDINQLKKAVEEAFAEEDVRITWTEVKNPDTQFAFNLEDPVPKGAVIWFSYKSIVTNFDPKVQKEYSNSAELKNPAGETIGNPSDKLTYKPALLKYDASTSSKITRDTTYYVGSNNVTYNGNKQTMKWGFDANLPASYFGDDSDVKQVIFADELPEGVSPVFLSFAGRAFTGIADATEDNPSELSISMPEVKATKEDVEAGRAEEEGEVLSEATTVQLSAWYDKSEGPNGTVKVLVPQDTIKYYKDTTYVFRLFAEIDKDFNWGLNERNIKEHSFENNVYLLSDTGDGPKQVLDAKQTQKILNDENARALVKGNLYNANEDIRNIPYRVVVNEEERDLVPDGDALNFKDTLTASYPWGVSVTLVPGSFKVYIVDKDSIAFTDSAKKKVDESKIRRYEDITDDVKFNHEAGKKSGDDWVITAVLPDDKAILVEYDYHISGYTSGRERVNLKNKTEIDGVATDSTNGQWSDALALQRSGAIVDIVEMTLAKVDSENENKTLPGAVFELYVYDGKDYIYTGDLVTDEEGVLKVNDEALQSMKEGIEFNYNTAYRVIEKVPPAGYKLNETPTDFFIMDRNKPIEGDDYSNAEYIPDDFAGYRLGLANAFVYFTNEKFTPLKIKKTSEGGESLEGAVFNLYRADENGEELIPYTKVKGVLEQEDCVTDENGEFTFSNWIKPGDYYLVETKAPAGGYSPKDEAIHFTYDGDEKIEFDSYEYVKFEAAEGEEPNIATIQNFKPSFEILKVADKEDAEVGDIIEYTITVTNTGKVIARDVQIQDILGQGLEYVSDNKNGENDNRITTWFRDIKAGETITFKLKARVVDASDGKVMNTARLFFEGLDEMLTPDDMSVVNVRDKGDANKVKKRSVGTGDMENLWLFGALMLISLFGIIVMSIRMRREHH